MAKKTIKNIDKVLKKFKQFGKEGDKIVQKVTYGNALEIVEDAKARAPKNIGKLSQSIHDVKIDDKNYIIRVGLDYGAYVEFGTGKKVSVPKELQDQASKFKGRKGSFKEGLQSIKDWCKSKGIDEKLAYPIFISILENGIQPQPYLYPAYIKGREQYIKDLKAEFKTLVNKNK